MSETFTPTPEAQKPAPQQPEEDNFAEIEAWQKNEQYQREAAERAQRIMAESAPTETAKNSWNRAVIAGTAGAALAAGLGGGLAIADHIAPGEIVATATSTVNQGEGIIDAVDNAVGQLEAKGVDPADIRNIQDTYTHAIEIHTDENGIVQPGENVEIAVKESPVFHIKSYEAVPKDSENNQ